MRKPKLTGFDLRSSWHSYKVFNGYYFHPMTRYYLVLQCLQSFAQSDPTSSRNATTDSRQIALERTRDIVGDVHKSVINHPALWRREILCFKRRWVSTSNLISRTFWIVTLQNPNPIYAKKRSMMRKFSSNPLQSMFPCVHRHTQSKNDLLRNSSVKLNSRARDQDPRTSWPCNRMSPDSSSHFVQY